MSRRYFKMLDEQTQRRRIYKVTQFRDSLQNIAEARPLNTVKGEILQGLFNICTQTSRTNAPSIQRELKGALTGTGTTRWYYIRLEKGRKTPNPLKFVHFKGNKTKEDPNEIHRLSIDGFKFYAYAISFIKPDGNGFYFIVHMQDTVKFMQLVNKANTVTEWDRGNQDALFTQIENECEEVGVKNTYDYKNIFKLDEDTRKAFFIECKKAGLTKEARKILKQQNAPCKPYDIIIEELEEVIEETEDAQERKEAEKELLRLTEEDNSWNNFKTTLEDYY